MKLTITTLTDLVITLDVSGDMELENFKALCALETNFDEKRIAIFFNGNLLTDTTKTLTNYGIQDGDMLLIKDTPSLMPMDAQQSSTLPQTIDFSGIQIPDGSATASSVAHHDYQQEAQNIFNTLVNNPEHLARLKINNPTLAEAFDEGIEKFTSVLKRQQDARAEEQQRRIRLLLADPFDSEAQRLIAEEIRLQQINSNWETAMEYIPELFAEVTMLYINCKVNNHPIKAFVDSGAQSTIMSKACAERCNVLHLVDSRFQGIARGVGTQKILGKIHLVQLEINGIFLPSSFQILEDQTMDMLLGLDMLRRYQCSIDLKSNVLRIGTTGTETPFLNESEIPKYAKLNLEEHFPDEHLQKAIQESLNNRSTNTTTSSSSTTTTNQSRSGSNSSSSSRHSEADIQELVAMGFKREQVIFELDQFNGDKIKAMASLFAKSIVVPDNI